MSEKRFRCPFEVQGREKGTILHIDLSDDRRERIRQAKNGFADFHADDTAVALEFRMPQEVQKKAKSNAQLKDLLIPYQSDIVTAELEYRLGSFSPYLFARLTLEARDALLNGISHDDTYRLLMGKSLATAMEESGAGFPREAQDVSKWLERTTIEAKKAGAHSPKQLLLHPLGDGRAIHLATLSGGSAVFEFDRESAVLKTRANKNCFGIVRSPFYPEVFGRYSPTVDLVMTREYDFVRLNRQTRYNIRFHSNTVLKEHGVAITDLMTDLQPDGVWDHLNDSSMAKQSK